MAQNDTKDSSQSLDNRSFNPTYRMYEFIAYGDNGDGTVSAVKNTPPVYLYHGKKTSGDYTYYAFKQQGGTKYRIMKKHNSTGSDVSWATGASGFTADWVDPTTLTYGEAPDGA